MSNHHTIQPRQPKGVPVGGQWTEDQKRAAGLSLLGYRPVGEDLLSERARLLEDEGYVPGVATAAVVSPSTTAKRAQWWDTHFVQAEYDESGGYLQMPDDYTPGRTRGHAMSGHRRTHRMAYSTGGVAVRMPSRTALHRFSSENGDATFDVPVSASLPNGDVQTWVRVTKTGPGSWEATALGMDSAGSARVAVGEAVAATLEGRSASMRPQSFGDLIERRKRRIAEQGIWMQGVRSQWISSVGYNQAAGVMATMTTNGSVYGHKVPKHVYKAVTTSSTPGAMFNKLVKGGERVGVERCEDCGRYKAAGAAHTCPAGHKAPLPAQDPQAVRAKARALGLVATPHSGADPGTGSTTGSGTSTGSTAGTGSTTGTGSGTGTGTSTAEAVSADGPVHVLAENERTIDMASMLADHAGEYREPGKTTDHGVQRGWTAKVLPGAMGQFTSSTYCPADYYSSSDGRDGQNGANGLISYAGLGSDAAQKVLAGAPEQALAQERQNDGPTVATMLAATVAHPGKVELGGYVVGQDRTDERLSADTAYIFGEDDASPQEVLAKAKGTYGLHDATRKPDNLDLVEVPWRPGEKAWRLWWD
ncbi:hypothetical protein GCG21_13720 [Pseudactinotalea sp. HY160]|uniref:hypothetical protein n=1 Tax=Pseudactinotalea sp. HY160 TaxID=2654490 RepID=UPI00128BFC3D|nr:hypothetical protein [Pseudactinotalea sp. HY160]MPV51045.1 hypothetical protein [Pseudactinotalea sp. HY160]